MKDFFVSYNQHDSDWAQWIAWQLEAAGFSVAIQAWDFRPGDNFVLNIDRAALETRTTIAVLSPSYLSSVYTQPEWAAAFARDPTSLNRALLPVRVRECELTGMLASIVYLDLIGLDESEAQKKLLAAVKGDRPKPDAPPPLPGNARANPTFPCLPLRPNYRNQHTRELGERTESLRKRRRELLCRGATEELQTVERDLLELKRQLREGPRLKTGDCLSNRYGLLEELGSGGFATVWQAFDEEANHQVALKVLHGQFSDSAERRERFWRGARAMQRLSRHPHIVHILDPHQEDGGYHYFVMEYVAGGTFLQAVTGGMTLENRIRVVLEIGDALSFAHDQGILHRDVTPDNILLDAPGGSSRLADFDLVRLPDSTGGTRTGALGKFLYAAPEAMETANEVDHRCDIFSLGMTTVFSVHGKKLPQAVLRSWDSFLRALDCPGEVKAVLTRATDHERENRYATMKEFCDSLREAFANRTTIYSAASPPSPPSHCLKDQNSEEEIARSVAQDDDSEEEIERSVAHDEKGQGDSDDSASPTTAAEEIPLNPEVLESTGPPVGGSDLAFDHRDGRPEQWPRIPGYEILQELGRGGMGVVYKARQLSLNRLVALKMILGISYSGLEALARFEREAQAIASLKHTNIVHVYDFGRDAEGPYIVMELVEGGSLRDLLRDTPLASRTAAELMELVARAMAHAHEQGIIHRDLKPGNILMAASPPFRTTSATTEPCLGVPKVTDFGLVRRLDQENTDPEGAIMGTPAYMAPEQAKGHNQLIGPATDVWSLGATLYEMLTGRRPFREGQTAHEILRQVIQEDPISPRRLQPKVPRVLEAICMKCLQKDLGQRYANAAELADDLHAYLGGRRTSVSPSFWRSLW